MLPLSSLSPSSRRSPKNQANRATKIHKRNPPPSRKNKKSCNTSLLHVPPRLPRSLFRNNPKKRTQTKSFRCIKNNNPRKQDSRKIRRQRNAPIPKGARRNKRRKLRRLAKPAPSYKAPNTKNNRVIHKPPISKPTKKIRIPLTPRKRRIRKHLRKNLRRSRSIRR